MDSMGRARSYHVLGILLLSIPVLRLDAFSRNWSNVIIRIGDWGGGEVENMMTPAPNH